MEIPSKLASPQYTPSQLGKTDFRPQLTASVNGRTGQPPEEVVTETQPPTINPSQVADPVVSNNTSLPDSSTDTCTVSQHQSAPVASGSPVNSSPSISSIPRLSGIPRFSRTPLTSRSASSSNDPGDRAGESHRNEHGSLQTPDLSSTSSAAPTPVAYGMYNQQPSRLSYPTGSISTNPLGQMVSRQTSNLSCISSNGNDRSRLGSVTGTAAVSGFRYDRTRSQNPCRSQDNVSEGSSSHSAGGTPKVITSKVNSLANMRYKPGGGNVSIVDNKVNYAPVGSKCNSLSNVKHTPGGGNVQIPQEKLSFSSVESRVQSLKNVKHIPTGGQVKIVSEKLQFSNTAKSKVGSLKNVTHNPGGGDVRIYNESLPWLKYNKPNLPTEEKARINKRSGGHSADMTSSTTSGGQ